jgi:membrane associated rhomboid family serine protease
MREASVGHQCPECVAVGRRTQRPVRTAFGGTQIGAKGYVTRTLIALNVLVAIIAFISARNSGADGQSILLSGGETPLHYWGAMLSDSAAYRTGNGVAIATGVDHGAYYRLVTAMFLHYGIIHLGLNMWALWVAGRYVEAALGPLRFTALYLVAGLGGNVCVYLFAGPHTLSAGASGAIFGLFGALIVLFRRMKLSLNGILPVVVLNLILTFSIPGISWQAHIGGLVVGILLAVAMAYAPAKSRNAVQAGATAVILVILAGLTVYQTSALTG